MIGHHDSSPRNGHQSDMSNWISIIFYFSDHCLYNTFVQSAELVWMKWIRLIFESRLSQPAEKVITHLYIDGLVHDRSISIAKTLEILQSCNKPSIYNVFIM